MHFKFYIINVWYGELIQEDLYRREASYLKVGCCTFAISIHDLINLSQKKYCIPITKSAIFHWRMDSWELPQNPIYQCAIQRKEKLPYNNLSILIAYIPGTWFTVLGNLVHSTVFFCSGLEKLLWLHHHVLTKDAMFIISTW